MYALLLLLAAPDVDRLGAPGWAAREGAERRLRSLGPLAWPGLLRAADSESPETRERVRRLLGPYRTLAAEMRAAGLLLGDYFPRTLPEWEAVCGDHQLRLRLHRMAAGLGVPNEAPGGWWPGPEPRPLDGLLPWNDDPSGWWLPFWWGCSQSLLYARTEVDKILNPTPKDEP